MSSIRINDPNNFLQVTIDGRSTDELRQEAVELQEWARTVLHDASDRVPQFGDKGLGLDDGVHKGPTKHVHSMEDHAQISRAQALDGNEVNPRLFPSGKRTLGLNAKSPYQYKAQAYNPSDANAGYEPKTSDFPTKKPTKLKPSKDTEI